MNTSKIYLGIFVLLLICTSTYAQQKVEYPVSVVKIGSIQGEAGLMEYSDMEELKEEMSIAINRSLRKQQLTNIDVKNAQIKRYDGQGWFLEGEATSDSYSVIFREKLRVSNGELLMIDFSQKEVCFCNSCSSMEFITRGCACPEGEDCTHRLFLSLQ